MTNPNPAYDNTDDGHSSTPASDPDPYSMAATRSIFKSSSSTVLPPHIDLNSLPQGLPLLSNFTGFNSARRIRTINARLASTQAMIHRPLTVQEDQAIAWHTAKGLALGSWGPTIGLASGLGWWWRTWGEMRWLWVGKMNDEGVNRSWKEYYEAQAAAAGEGAAATGTSAKKPPIGFRWDNGRLWVGDRELMKAWNPIRKEATIHGLRALPYIGLFSLVASFIMSSYAATVTAVGEGRDPRLEGLERELRGQVEQSLRRKRGDMPGVTSGVGKGGNDTMGWGTRTASEADDASPTGGEGFFGETEIEERARMMGNSSEPKPQRRQGSFQQSPPNPFQTTERQGGGFQQDRYETQARKSDSAFDDASPTAGTADSSTMGSNDDGASVWARIRQDSASGSPSEQHPSRSSGGKKWAQRPSRGQQQQQKRDDDEDESFAHARTEEERQYARDEAQRDFDARIERERAGGEFSSGSGSGSGSGRDGKW